MLAGKGGVREMRLYTSISEYWNNSNAAFPTFVPLGASIYTRRTEIFERLPGTRHSLRFRGPSSPPRKGRTDNRQWCARARGERRLKAVVRNSSPFVRYQGSARERAREPMSSASFDAEIPRDPRG